MAPNEGAGYGGSGLRRDRGRGARAPGRRWRCCWPARATGCCWWTGRRSPATPCRPTSSTRRASPRCSAGGCSTRLTRPDARRSAGTRSTSGRSPGRRAGHRRLARTRTRPRRTVLDKILVDAAAEAGAEVREGFTVEEVRVERRAGDRHPRARRGRGDRRGAGPRRGRRGRAQLGGGQGRAGRRSTRSDPPLTCRLLLLLEQPADRRTLRGVQPAGPRLGGLPDQRRPDPGHRRLAARRAGRAPQRHRGHAAARRSSWRRRSPSGSATPSARSGWSARRCRTTSGRRPGRAGRWSATPVTAGTSSPRRASPTRSCDAESCAPARSTQALSGARPTTRRWPATRPPGRRGDAGLPDDPADRGAAAARPADGPAGLRACRQPGGDGRVRPPQLRRDVDPSSSSPRRTWERSSGRPRPGNELPGPRSHRRQPRCGRCSSTGSGGRSSTPAATACSWRRRADGRASAATTARTATPAQTQKPMVNASSVGRPCGGGVRGDDGRDDGGADAAADGAGDGVDAGRLAGLGGRDALDDGVRHGREREADAGAGEHAGGERPARSRRARGRAARTRRRPRPRRGTSAASGRLAVQDAGERAEDDHHDDGRQQEQARPARPTCRSRSRSRRAAAAGSGPAGTCRTSRSRGSARPGRWPRRRGCCISRMSISGSCDPQLDEDEDDQRDDAEGEQADGLRRRPSPTPGPC